MRHLLRCCCLFAVLGATAPLSAAVFTVDTESTTIDTAANAGCDERGNALTAADLPGSDDRVSLPEAICAANSSAEADTIVFAPAVRRIVLTAPHNYWYGANALPPIHSEIEIDGGAAGVAIERGGSSPFMRFFYIAGRLHALPAGGVEATPGALVLRRLTLAYGLARGGNGGEGAGGGGGAGMGGAIFNQGELVIDSCTLLNNAAVGGSGGESLAPSVDAPDLFGGGGGGLGGHGDTGLGAVFRAGGGGGFRSDGDTWAGGSDGGGFIAYEGGYQRVGNFSLGGGSAIGGDGGEGLRSGGGGGGFVRGADGSDGASFAGSSFDGGLGADGGGDGGSGADFPIEAAGGGAFGGGGAGAFVFGAGGGGVGGGGGFGAGGGGSGYNGDVAVQGVAGRGGFGGGGGGARDGGNRSRFGGGGGGGLSLSITPSAFSALGGFAANGGFGGGGGAALGGAVFNHFGGARVVNSTLYENLAVGGRGGSVSGAGASGAGGAALGGAIFNLNGEVELLHSTLTRNNVVPGIAGTATAGGLAHGHDGATLGAAVFNAWFADPGVGNSALVIQGGALPTAANTLLWLRSSIIAGSSGDDEDCYNWGASVGESGANLVARPAADSARCGSATIAADPQLGALADNGGPTRTALPGASSPALDAAGITCAVARDQRGEPRPVGAGCDLGAVERGVFRFADGFE